MFNDQKVSSSIQGQVSNYFAQEYPTFVSFLKDYYAFLETNSNPLDILGNISDLINIDTFTEVDAFSTLVGPLTEDADEITVSGDVNFPPTDGLLKIDDEVILYKSKKVTENLGFKFTVFSKLTRGHSYNDLSVEGELSPNVPTVASSHSPNVKVYNQSFTYILYLLEKIREQYLIDFPKQVLEDNLDTVNVDTVIKRIRDFYISKGTPKAISFYFQFLYQESADITNYKDLLMGSSDATYQSKEIVRIETLDNYPLGALADRGAILVQGTNEFPVQTVENVFSFASQVFEIEIANGRNIVPTNFTKVTTQFRVVGDIAYIYVDSTYNFTDEGSIRIGDKIYTYYDKQFNYFMLRVSDNPSFEVKTDDYVYDVATLSRIKERGGSIIQGSYFIIYAGVSDFEIIKNTTYYQEGDLGFVTNLIDENNLVVTSWTFNDQTPLVLNEDIISGVTQVYTDIDSVYVYTSSIPYYKINPNDTFLEDNNIEIRDAKLFKKIPKVFEKAVDTLQESTPANSVVGILRDGTFIHNWKSEERIIRGGIQTIDIINNGDNFAINNPPTLKIESPFNGAIGEINLISSTTVSSGADTTYTVNGFSQSGFGARFVVTRNSSGSINQNSIKVDENLPGNSYAVGVTITIDGADVGGVSEDDDITLQVTAVWSGTQAEAEMVVDGKVKEVYIKDSGTGYPSKATAISVEKDPSDTVFTGDNFRDAILRPVVVDGQITKVRIIDEGTGYTKPPTVIVTPILNVDVAATIELQVGGPVTNINITNNGNLYRSNPSIEIIKGTGASGILNIDQGTITTASIITGGSEYNSRPIVRAVDSADTPGFGAVLLADWNPSSKQVEGINILNGGLGYNETTTTLEIFEPGEDLIINANAKFYTKVNNTNPNLFSLIRSDTGAFYTDSGGILTDEQGNEIFLREYSILGAPLKLDIRNPISKERETVNLTNNTVHSPLIGWALDGAPIYGPYGYSNPLNSESDIQKMRSGYKKKAWVNMQTGRNLTRSNGGLRTDYDRGQFEQDYEWTSLNADLDENNGRFTVTPEYPQGVYAYFLTADTSDYKLGFPYFIGTKFAGKTFEDFNNRQFVNIESIPNLRRYLDFDATIAPKPIDTGFFQVESIPKSTDASLDFIDVITPGSGYKFGDVIVFNNEGTGGTDAAGFVSVLKGQPVTSVSKTTFDYLEYTNDFGSFSAGDNIATSEGFLAKIHSIDTIHERMYLTNADTETEIIGDNPDPNSRDIVYNTELTLDTQSVSELVGTNISTNAITSSESFAQLNESNGISTVTTTFLIDSFTNATITNFTPSSGNPVYIKVGSEIMKVVSTQGSNRLIVSRGVNTVAKSHVNNVQVTILTSVPVFDSSQYSIGDYISIGTEKMKIVDVIIEKNVSNQVVAVRIDDSTGTTGGTQYYVYFDGEIQSNTNTADVITLDVNGKITDIEFTPTATEYIANPTVYLSTSSSAPAGADFPPNIVDNVTLTATTYNHTLIVERAVLGTTLENNVSRTDVQRLFFSTAEVTKYEEDRIVSNLSASNNGLVIGDSVSISASTGQTETFEIYQPTNSGLSLSTGQLFNSAYSNGLTLYEGSIYEFDVSYTIGTYQNIEVKFFTPGTVNRREYFDINIEKQFGTSGNSLGKLVKFTLKPDDSDLTKLNMQIRNISNDAVTIIPLTIIAEPINGTYDVINSLSGSFEIYNENDPDPNGDLFTQYNQNKVSYTTTSKNADGPISRVTLTNNGVNYQQVPEISSIITTGGEGAILEAVSTKVGTISSVKAINSGYGYSPDPTQKPTLIFPVIAKLKNNFTVQSVNVNDTGEGYLFQPRMNVTGGGLTDGSLNHAQFNPIVNSRIITDVEVISPGSKYSSAPTITAEKYYYISFISGTDINFNINFKQYFQQGDPFKIRAYYFANATDEVNNVYSYIESATVYAYLGNVSLKARATASSNVNLEPLDQSNWSDDITNIITNAASGLYYEAINFARNAQFTAIIQKSPFSGGEKVNISRVSGGNLVTVGTGQISNINGWQENNSILRINNITTKLQVNDEIIGLNTLALGIVDQIFSVETSAELDALVQTPEQFLDDGSFIGSNALKIQDSNRYQKFAYQIGVQTPFVNWKENYENALHPAGYKVFSKTDIISPNLDKIVSLDSAVANVGTTSAELAQLRRKYNFLVAKNQPGTFDQVIIENKLLTDVLNIKTSIVGVFEDISDQFDGVQTLFELKVIDPITPTLNGAPNFITEYEVDQMVVLLDNIIQTYGTSWEVIDADKVIAFTPQRNSGDPMPDGETLSYRQFNEANGILTMNQTTVAATSTFSLNQTDGTPWAANTFTSIDKDEYFVVVDGVIQRNDNFAISAGGGSPTITFTDDDVSNTPVNLPVGTQISVRRCDAFLKNELYTGSGGSFTPGSVTAGSAVVLSNKPTTPASKHDYFVFVDGILISPEDYELDGSKDLVFDYSFNYDTLIVLIDSNGVSLNESTHGISATNYVYKIEDGQLEIPTGFVILPEQYVIDIAGIVQTPHVVYDTRSSGIRKIRFFEPPSRFIIPNAASDRSEIGRQFIGLLYTREDPQGNTTTPNYQFDDVSTSRIHVKEGFDNFITGDYINTSTSAAVIKNKTEKTTIKSVSTGLSPNTSVAAGGTVDITLSSSLRIFVGDRVLFNAALGLTSTDNDELEISAIDTATNVVTLTNIGSSTLTLNIASAGTIRFLHREFIVIDIDTTNANRDDAFTAGDTLESGIVSSLRTGVSTLTNEPFGALITDTEITVDDASNFSQNDYLVINEVEIVKITNISTNTLTVDRAQLSTNAVLHGDGVIVEKITPYTITVGSFVRGFDGNKTTFPLQENGVNIDIGTDKDIFVIVNGILQKKGGNESYEINSIGSAPNQYSVLVFDEAPPEGAPFNVFYLGEVRAIKDISPLFNASDRAFNLIDPTNDEIFSLIAKSRPEANISANLILFVDGSLQIPSTEEAGREAAYPSSLVSYKLFGSVVEFTSPPKNGATFEGYIYTGSNDDFDLIDVDPPVEREDIIIQSNERRPREVNLVVSANKLSVGSSFGQLNNTPDASEPLLIDGEQGYWFTDLLQSADVRETLRARRTLKAKIKRFVTSPYPITQSTLLTSPITELNISNISSDLPTTTDINAFLSITLAENSKFPIRKLNCVYSDFAPRSSGSSTNYEFVAADVNTSSNEIQLTATTGVYDSHALTQGATITYQNQSNTDMPGLTNGTTYYVHVVDRHKIKLATTKYNLANSNFVDITGTTSGTHLLNGKDVDTITNLTVGFDLKFDQIVKLASTASSETFSTLTTSNTGEIGSLTIFDQGSGFPNGTTSNVNLLVEEVGDPGENAVANITVSAGVVTSVEIINRGSNYIDGQIVLVDGFIGVKLKISFIDSTIYYDGGTKKATIIGYTPGETVDGSSSTSRYLYVKLDDPSNPITTYAANNATGAITNVKSITHQVEDDDLMIDYQSLSYNDDFIYDF